jgi:hypothetical protein
LNVAVTGIGVIAVGFVAVVLNTTAGAALSNVRLNWLAAVFAFDAPSIAAPPAMLAVTGPCPVGVRFTL